MNEQLSILGSPNNSQKVDKKKICVVFIDGAARGNPGPAGAGIYIKKNGASISKGFYLGEKTNNQAEYLALAIAVLLLEKECKDGYQIEITSDSELLVKQMNGIYKVKNPVLKKIRTFISKNLHKSNCKFKHVLREYNKVADKLANISIDKKNLLPENLVSILKDYEIL